MTTNYLLLRLFSILTCLLACTVANKAIIGGSPHSGYQVPFSVSVQVQDHGHVCGGGIIGERFILSAAHYLINRSRGLRSSHISVLVGTDNLTKTNPPAVILQVEKVFFPTEFHPMAHFSVGDIAVLRLAHSLQLEHHRKSITKLHLPQQYYQPQFTGAIIAGFGWTEYNNGFGDTNSLLHIAPYDIIPNKDCEEAFSIGAIQTDIHLCAKHWITSHNRNKRTGVCTGDGGSPLIVNRTTVIGILSRIPFQCDERYEPGVYTRVTHYVSRIFNVMEHGHDSNMASLDA